MSDSKDFWSNLNPQDFFSQFPEHLRPEAILSPSQAASRADVERKKLFEIWSKLHEIVQKYEHTIRKRWAKRTLAKRREFLLEVQPKIPKVHAAEVNAVNDPLQGSNLPEHRDTFLFPFANREDLSINGGIQFLSLLHHRAHRFPSEFSEFDGDVLHFGIVSGAIRRIHAQDCTLVSFGLEDTYGRVVGYNETLNGGDDEPTGFELENVWGDAMPVSEGLPIIEAQTKLLDFLLRAALKILGSSNDFPKEADMLLPPPSIPPSLSGDGWESIARTNSLRPYLEPPSFSLDKLFTMANSQYQLAVDNLIDLRTDPSFLAERLQLYLHHRLETMPSVSPPCPQELVHDRAVTFLLTDAYGDFVHWHMIKTVLGEIVDVQKIYPGPYLRGTRLPEVYESALQELAPALTDCLAKAHTRFPLTFCSSPPLRRYFQVRFSDHRFAKNEIMGTPPKGDQLMGTLSILLNKQQTHLWQLSRLYDRLDRLTEAPGQRERISPLLSEVLSELGTYNDFSLILDYHRPKIRPLLESETRERVKRWIPLLGGFARSEGQVMNLDGVAFPVSQFLYPKGPKDPAWAKKCEAVDDSTARFWKEADQQLLGQVGHPLSNLVRTILEPHLGKQTKWADLIQTSSPPEAPTSPSPASSPPFGGVVQHPAIPDTVPKHPPHAKAKTRGDSSVPQASEPEDAQEKETRIPVSLRVHKVFSALFRLTDSEQIHSQKGSIAWTDILHAFTQVGFAVTKTRGSAWRFEDLGGNSMTVHEPHPEPKLDFWKARRLGKRLTRRFGWTGGEFFVQNEGSAKDH